MPVVAHESGLVGCAAGVSQPETMEVNVGVYPSPEEFLAAASKLQHPFNGPPDLPTFVTAAVESCCSLPILRIKLNFEKKMLHWTRRERELRDAEDRLHARSDTHVRRVVRAKRCLLLEEILRGIGYPDVAVCRNIARGSSQVGRLEKSGVFPPKIEDEPLEVATLLSTARRAQEEIARTMGPSGNVEEDWAVLEETEREEEQGWISGAMTAAEVTEAAGRWWMLVRRFVVWQSGKYRIIDDMSEHGQNSTVASSERLDSREVDDVAALAKAWLRAVPSASDHALRETGLEGVGVDLKSAYKQLAILPSHRSFSVLVIWNPRREVVEYRLAYSLTFGGRSNVYHFNRAGRALEAALNVEFGIPVRNYFDDFPIVAPSPLALFFSALLLGC